MLGLKMETTETTKPPTTSADDEEEIQPITLESLPPETIDHIFSYLPEKCLAEVASLLCKSPGSRAEDVLVRRLASEIEPDEWAERIQRRKRVSHWELRAIKSGKWDLEEVGRIGFRAIHGCSYTNTDLAKLFVADFEQWYLGPTDKCPFFIAIGHMLCGTPESHSDFGDGEPPTGLAFNCQWFFIRLALEILANEIYASRFDWTEYTSGMLHVFKDWYGAPMPSNPFRIPLMTRAAVQRWFDEDASPSLDEMARQLGEDLARFPTCGADFDGWNPQYIVRRVAEALPEATIFNGVQATKEEMADLILACSYFTIEVCKDETEQVTRDQVLKWIDALQQEEESTTVYMASWARVWDIPPPLHLTHKIANLLPKYFKLSWTNSARMPRNSNHWTKPH